MTFVLNAYVLAADPAFAAASVRSYYDIVDRIVVSYDEAHLSWSGEPTEIEECLAEIRAIDQAGKLDLQPGPYSHPELPPMECETRQRRAALDVAGRGAGWVLQLDTDEVVPEPETLLEMVRRADNTQADGLDFPSRWLYARTDDGRFLERGTRWWRPAAGYPGALAIRTGTHLRFARQCEGELYRVDFRERNTDPWHDESTPVHATVPLHAGVLHFSWVRSDAEIDAKAIVSGHRDDVDWAAAIRRWKYRRRHPRCSVALSPLRGRESWLRLVRLPLDPPTRLLDGSRPLSR